MRTKRCGRRYLPKHLQMHHPWEGYRNRRADLLDPGQHGNHASSFHWSRRKATDVLDTGNHLKNASRSVFLMLILQRIFPRSWRPERRSTPSSTRRLKPHHGRWARPRARPPLKQLDKLLSKLEHPDSNQLISNKTREWWDFLLPSQSFTEQW